MDGPAAPSPAAPHRDAAVLAAVERLTTHWATFWPGADVDALAADVLDRLDDAVAAWEVRDLRLLPGGNVALVAAAHVRGRSMVLKLHPRGHPEEAGLRAEGDALAFWRPTGAVPALAARRDGGLTLLLVRVEPGTTLDASRPSFEDRLTVLGRLAARLHAAGTPPGSIPHLQDEAAAWRRALGDDPATLAELDDLTTPTASDVLVHADLHGGNALLGPHGWQAIDPHAARGDRHADVWALLDPLVPALPADPEDAARTAWRRVAHLAGAAGTDPGRTARWTRLRARVVAAGLEAASSPPPADAAWADRLRRTASALAHAPPDDGGQVQAR